MDGFKRYLRAVLAPIFATVMAVVFCGTAALAQDTAAPENGVSISGLGAGVEGSFVILDPERLYAESAFGLAVQEDLRVMAQEIQSENGKLTQDLETEELRLLDQRAVLSAEEFRLAADAFDQKVQGIRDAQERKAQELSSRASEGRQAFNQASLPVLQIILKERRALGILDSRVILLPDPSIDITNEAILRVDQALRESKP